MEHKIISRRIQFDESGFLVKPETWNEDVAELIAYRQGLNNLSEAHWNAIYRVRYLYAECNNVPMVGKICADLNLTLKDIYKLFYNGPVKGLIKIAGLPKPDNCL